MEKSWKKKGTKSQLTLCRRSQQFCVKNKKECVYHNDHCEYERGNMPTSSKPTLQTICGVQTTSSMAKIAVASVQTKRKVQHPCLAKLIPNPRNQLALSILNEIIKEVSYKRNF